MRQGVTAFAWIVLAGAVPTCQAADVYRVAGIVINSETGSPLSHAFVVVRTGTAQTVATQTVGADGRFAFELPQGKFNLLAGMRDAPQQFGIRTPDSGIGTALVTGPDQDTSNLTFRWFPPGAISGKIVDEAGEPVEVALVQLVRSTVVAGRRVVGTAGWVWTDDRGEYRFGALRGGSYFLAVTGTPWYSRSRMLPFNHSAPSLAYASVYYPNTSDVSRAAPIVLKPGQEARADFSLSVVMGATVTVKHDAPNGLKGLIGLLSDGIGRGYGFQRQESFSGGPRAFTFEAVPPGRYLVRLTGSKGTSDFSGRQVIDVNGLDVAVELQVRPAPTVSGTVQLKNPKAKLPGRLLASLIREDNGAVISTIVRPDGSFVFPSVAGAKWRPGIRGDASHFLSDVQVEGADFRDGAIDLLEGETVTLRLTASDETGRVQGFVMRGDAAVEGVLVVLAPASGVHDQTRYHGFQTDSDGSFDFEHVPVGDYLWFAVEDTGIEYTQSTAVRPYLADAKRVHIEAHGVYSEKIHLSEVREENKR